jgi:sarcosine oxidase subunit alpha
MVRTAVGVCDVSTLGKIDIQGRDAAEFLNRIYSNPFLKVPVGKVRYGLMLREDGMVMDDGTCARLGDERFLITSTTGAADHVLSHLEFAHQVLWPDLQVAILDVTEAWCQIAVAGPEARRVLTGAIGKTDWVQSLGFMETAEIRIDDQPARVFRISFSGELGFEIAVPPQFAPTLAGRLVEEARKAGGGLYGLEALNVLRIEKGFLTHAELHGRVTVGDVGLAQMMSSQKDFIGKTLNARPGLQSDREQLVGLKPSGAVQNLLGGMHLYEPEAEQTRENGQGYLTSVCFSPTLGSMIALGFLKNGYGRIGETVRATDHLRQLSTLCEVVALPFYDTDGERMRG